MASVAAGMPTWAMTRSPVSPSPREVVGSPQVRENIVGRRPISAPAPRLSSRRVESITASPAKKACARRVGSKPMRQPQPWAPQCNIATAEKRPWMMLRATNPITKPPSSDEHSQVAKYNGDQRHRRGYSQPGKTSSFTPPPREPLRQLQGQTGKKQSCNTGSRRRENSSPVVKDARKKNNNDIHGEKHSSRKMSQDSRVATAYHQEHVDEKELTCELEKENVELRALAVRLQEELAAVEDRRSWYQNAAEELTRNGISLDYEDYDCDADSHHPSLCPGGFDDYRSEPSDHSSPVLENTGCWVNLDNGKDRILGAVAPQALWS